MNKIRMYKAKMIKGMILLFMLLLLLNPGASYRGASIGLLLWFHNVLPVLLPFIILSNLMVKLNIAGKISHFFYPLLGRPLGLSREGCYPILIGFLSGIPMGAKATADMLRENRLSKQQAQFLIGMCNNASPMFIIGFISITQLKLPQLKYVLVVIIYISAILAALIWRFLSTLYKKPANRDLHTTAISDTSIIKSYKFTFELLDGSIMNGFETITRIGGYIILFSILAQLLKEPGYIPEVLKTAAMSLLEITTGISSLCSLDLKSNIKIVLVAALTSFGGLSGIAQTKSVLQDSRLSISSYVSVKLLNALIAGILCYIYLVAF